MLIERLRLTNLLSFGPDSPALDLRPLNVLIGPNGSGKSNLIEAIGLLSAAPTDLVSPIDDGGGIGNWVWQGRPKARIAEIEADLAGSDDGPALDYQLAFLDRGHGFGLASEKLRCQDAETDDIDDDGVCFVRPPREPFDGEKPSATDAEVFTADNHRQRYGGLEFQQSLLYSVKDRLYYPHICRASDVLRDIRIGYATLPQGVISQGCPFVRDSSRVGRRQGLRRFVVRQATHRRITRQYELTARSNSMQYGLLQEVVAVCGLDLAAEHLARA